MTHFDWIQMPSSLFHVSTMEPSLQRFSIWTGQFMLRQAHATSLWIYGTKKEYFLIKLLLAWTSNRPWDIINRYPVKSSLYSKLSLSASDLLFSLECLICKIFLLWGGIKEPTSKMQHPTGKFMVLFIHNLFSQLLQC